MNQKNQQSYDQAEEEDQEAAFGNEFLQEKFEQIFQKHPNLTVDQAFYLQYYKLYVQTIRIQQQVQETSRQIQKLKGITERHPCKMRKNISHNVHNDTSNSERRKRIRRTANQIARHYVCRVQKCQKSYGSEGSLNQHMKLKHKQLFDGMSGAQYSEK